MKPLSFPYLLAFLLTSLCLLPAGRSVAAAEEPYRIQPGDVLNVTVAPQTAYGRVVTVQPDGKLNYPVVGETTAAGKTVAELTRAIAEGLEKELNNPRVTISIQSTAPVQAPQITVLGAVQEPGLYDLRPGWRLTEALAAAGGPKPNADLRRVTVTGKDQSVRTASLLEGELPAHKNNLELREGDLVVVLEGEAPRAPSITVLGAVRSPGLFPLRPGWRLMEALAAAGGPTEAADLKRVSVTHQDRTVQIANVTPDARGVHGDNWEVKDGDLILVMEAPRERATVTVLGEVVRPGVYEFVAGATLLEALTLAGGPSPRADLKRVSLARNGREGMETLDLGSLLKGSVEEKNSRLQPGDTLIVPESRNRVVVIGEVARQGEQLLEGQDTVLDLLVRAGGPSGSANLSKATLMRKKGDGPPEIIPVNLKKLTTKNDQETVAVLPGDLLFIPPRDQSRGSNLINYLSPLTLLFNAFGF